MSVPKKILEVVMSLTADNRAELVDCLLASLDKPDKAVDQQWSKEAESRINAYDRGEINTLKIEEVLSKYR
ncbi:MAG: addiction module protein [Thiotrichaceae bacterium]|nr:addiction module protein [Thiotrichaceae bacterium]PCI12252.1 MAG: hypothetical protein COB71_09825 [Thiotrichales bacterium]